MKSADSMREIEKLFRKISKKERDALLESINSLLQKKHHGLNVKKLQGSDFYRMRTRMFRIIFHYEAGEIVIDSVRLRAESTYKDF